MAIESGKMRLFLSPNYLKFAYILGSNAVSRVSCADGRWRDQDILMGAVKWLTISPTKRITRSCAIVRQGDNLELVRGVRARIAPRSSRAVLIRWGCRAAFISLYVRRSISSLNRKAL